MPPKYLSANKYLIILLTDISYLQSSGPSSQQNWLVSLDNIIFLFFPQFKIIFTWKTLGARSIWLSTVTSHSSSLLHKQLGGPLCQKAIGSFPFNWNIWTRSVSANDMFVQFNARKERKHFTRKRVCIEMKVRIKNPLISKD